MHLIYLLLSSTIICNKGAVKKKKKLSVVSRAQGLLEQQPTGKVCCKLVIHIAGRVPGGAMVGEAPTGELTGGECDL